MKKNLHTQNIYLSKGSYSQIVLFQIGFGWRAEPIATSVRIIDEHAIVGLPRIQINNVKYLLVIILWYVVVFDDGGALYRKKTFRFSSTHLTMSAASIRRWCFMYISSSSLFDLILFWGVVAPTCHCAYRCKGTTARRSVTTFIDSKTLTPEEDVVVRIISRKTRETNIFEKCHTDARHHIVVH